MGIKMSTKIPWLYLMAMSSIRKQKFIDQLSCKISKIMRKQILNGRLAAILDFITARFKMGYLCVRHYSLLYIHGAAILHFFELRKYHKIIIIQNGH